LSPNPSVSASLKKICQATPGAQVTP
jgi:hypothetical protein